MCSKSLDREVQTSLYVHKFKLQLHGALEERPPHTLNTNGAFMGQPTFKARINNRTRGLRGAALRAKVTARSGHCEAGAATTDDPAAAGLRAGTQSPQPSRSTRPTRPFFLNGPTHSGLPP